MTAHNPEKRAVKGDPARIRREDEIANMSNQHLNPMWGVMTAIAVHLLLPPRNSQSNSAGLLGITVIAGIAGIIDLSQRRP